MDLQTSCQIIKKAMPGVRNNGIKAKALNRKLILIRDTLKEKTKHQPKISDYLFEILEKPWTREDTKRIIFSLFKRHPNLIKNRSHPALEQQRIKNVNFIEAGKRHRWATKQERSKLLGRTSVTIYFPQLHGRKDD